MKEKIKKIPITPFEIIKRMPEIPKLMEWSKSKHLWISGPEFWGIHHIFIDKFLKHIILLSKEDLTTHALVGTPTEAREYRKYDKNVRLIFSEKVDKFSFEWKIYKDYVLYKGHGLPPKDIPEEPYFGKVIRVEDFNDGISDEWIISQIRKLYKN